MDHVDVRRPLVREERRHAAPAHGDEQVEQRERHPGALEREPAFLVRDLLQAGGEERRRRRDRSVEAGCEAEAVQLEQLPRGRVARLEAADVEVHGLRRDLDDPRRHSSRDRGRRCTRRLEQARIDGRSHRRSEPAGRSGGYVRRCATCGLPLTATRPDGKRRGIRGARRAVSTAVRRAPGGPIQGSRDGVSRPRVARMGCPRGQRGPVCCPEKSPLVPKGLTSAPQRSIDEAGAGAAGPSADGPVGRATPWSTGRRPTWPFAGGGTARDRAQTGWNRS